MSDSSIFDQLDHAVSAVLDGHGVGPASPAWLLELVETCRDLKSLPSENFYNQLRKQLETEAMSSPNARLEPALEVFPKLSAYLCYHDAAAAIEFYKRVFGAEELMRYTEPNGKIGHAELKFGKDIVMLSDEYPDHGVYSPKTLGGSPVKLHLSVEDVDALAQRAIEAGATIVRPIEEQFYGDRSGQLADPFGYTWIVSSHIEDVSEEEIQRRLSGASSSTPETADTSFKREGFHAVTPYLTVEKAAELLDFVGQAFGAEEKFRTTGSAGGVHAEVMIGDSMLMIGGGPGIPERPAAIHLYLPDVDQIYARAIASGATPMLEPADQPYGERSGAVIDPTGNRWYIATPFVPLKEIDKDLHTISLYFHPVGAPKLIEFLTAAFGAEEVHRHASDEGYVYHAKVRIGDSIVEMGEARDPAQPMKMAIYLYVPDVDSMYERALSAGATSVAPPMDQPYGDRNAWVSDPFGNVWYLATQKKA